MKPRGVGASSPPRNGRGQTFQLKVSIHSVKGNCNMPMNKGDYFLLKGGKLIIPEGRHFCLWALQSVVPFLAAKYRNIVEKDDWLEDVQYVSCPDPGGKVILKIERCPVQDAQQSAGDAASGICREVLKLSFAVCCRTGPDGWPRIFDPGD